MAKPKQGKRKASGPFEDPTLNAFYRETIRQGRPDTDPVGGYSWTMQDLNKAMSKAAGRTVHAHGKYKDNLSAEVEDLWRQVQSEKDKNKRYGGKNEDSGKREGVLSRVLDVISRPNYAVMETISRGVAERGYGGEDYRGGGVDDTFKAMAEGFWGGLSGKDKTTGSDVIQEAADALHAGHAGKSPRQIRKGEGHVNPWVKYPLGLTGDIFLDPSTYVGFGLASKMGRVGSVAKSSGAMKAALEKIGVHDDDIIKTLTHESYTAGRQTKAAARAARKNIDEAADFAAKLEGTKVYNKLLEEGVDAKTALGKSQVAKGNMQVQLRKMADDILEAPGYRNIAIKAGSGLGQKGLEIPLSRFAVAAAAAPFKGLGKWDPAARAAGKFQELFSNSAKIFPELQQLRLEHRSSGLARVHFRGEFLTKTFTPFTKTQRQGMLEDALQGNFSTGLTVKNATGGTDDAAKFIHDRLRAVQNNFTSDMIHYDLRLEPEDVNRFSKYAGLTFKKSGPDDNNWIINSLKDSKIKDAGEALFVVESAMEQALARRTMLKSFADTWGARSGSIAEIARKHGFKVKDLPDELRPYRNHKKLLSEGWRTVNGKTGKPIKELDGVIFDPDTAKGMERILGLLDDEREMASFLQGINNLTGKWKFFVTVPNPGFHIRNSIGDAYINIMDSVSPKAYEKAGRLITKKKMFESPGVGQQSPFMVASHDRMMRAAELYKPVDKRYNTKFLKIRGAVKGTDGKVKDAISPAEVWAAYNRYGMRQNYTISEYGKAFDEKRLAGGIIEKIKSPFVKFSEDREDYFRLAHFMHLVETNPSKAKDLDKVFSFAAQRVRETHFDYTDFTKFEKQVMSNAIPFYKWTRKSLPLQTELLFTQPGRVAVIPKAMRTMSEAMGYDWENWNYLDTQRVVPKWMRDAGFMPGNFGALPGLGGPQNYFNVTSPFGDAATQWATPVAGGSPSNLLKQIASQLNPAIKMPIEYTTNQRLYTGAPIVRDKEGPNKGKIKDLADYLSEQTPITRVAAKAAQKEDTTPAAAWSWLLGLSIQSNTEQRQLSELYRQRDNTRGRFSQTRARFLKKRGLKEDFRLR